MRHSRKTNAKKPSTDESQETNHRKGAFVKRSVSYCKQLLLWIQILFLRPKYLVFLSTSPACSAKMISLRRGCFINIFRAKLANTEPAKNTQPYYFWQPQHPKITQCGCAAAKFRLGTPAPNGTRRKEAKKKQTQATLPSRLYRMPTVDWLVFFRPTLCCVLLLIHSWVFRGSLALYPPIVSTILRACWSGLGGSGVGLGTRISHVLLPPPSSSLVSSPCNEENWTCKWWP